MSFMLADLDAIEAAIISGVLEVRYGDKVVKYQSISELLKARQLIQEALGLTALRPRSSFSSFSKG